MPSLPSRVRVRSLTLEIISRYVALGNEFGSLMTDLIYESHLTSPELSRFASSHFDYCIDRSNAIYLLLRQHAYWDAEIVMRPLIECTVRMCYVCYAPSDAIPNLIEEYARSLYEVNRLEQSERAKKSQTLAYATRRGGGRYDNPIILPSDAEEYLRSRWPKSKRQALKQKWSFSEMIKQLDQWVKPHFKIDIFSNFIHSYGISSHLIHADESGMGVVSNRKAKPENEQSMMETTHLNKLLDLALTSSMLTTIGMAVVTNNRVEEAVELVNKYVSLQSREDPAVVALMEKWALKGEELNSLDRVNLGLPEQT